MRKMPNDMQFKFWTFWQRGDIKSPVLRHIWLRQRSLTWESRLHTGPGGCPFIGPRNPPVAPTLTQKQLQAFLGLTGYCRVWIPNYGLMPSPYMKTWGDGMFNPTDVGYSSEGGRGYTKTSLNSSNCLEVAKPRKSIPTLCPWKRRNSLGSVKS